MPLYHRSQSTEPKPTVKGPASQYLLVIFFFFFFSLSIFQHRLSWPCIFVFVAVWVTHGTHAHVLFFRELLGPRGLSPFLKDWRTGTRYQRTRSFREEHSLDISNFCSIRFCNGVPLFSFWALRC